VGHMLWFYDGSLVFPGNLGPEFLLSVPRLSALTIRGESGTPSTCYRNCFHCPSATISLGAFSFGSYVRASLLLLYFWGSPCVPCIPSFWYARIGGGASAEAGHTPQCVLCPSEAVGANS